MAVLFEAHICKHLLKYEVRLEVGDYLYLCLCSVMEIEMEMENISVYDLEDFKSETYWSHAEPTFKYE